MHHTMHVLDGPVYVLIVHGIYTVITLLCLKLDCHCNSYCRTFEPPGECFIVVFRLDEIADAGFELTKSTRKTHTVITLTFGLIR